MQKYFQFFKKIENLEGIYASFLWATDTPVSDFWNSLHAFFSRGRMPGSEKVTIFKLFAKTI